MVTGLDVMDEVLMVDESPAKHSPAGGSAGPLGNEESRRAFRAKLRAPQNSGESLAVPSLDVAGDAILANEEVFRTAGIDVQGRGLSELRNWTQKRIVESATHYTRGLTQCSTETAFSVEVRSTALESQTAKRLIVSGHQPELFHPGVWAKNFALAGLGQRHAATTLHLVVDSDTCEQAGVMVPTGSSHFPRNVFVPLAERAGSPWEDMAVEDRSVLTKFGPAVSKLMHAWGIPPVAERLGPLLADATGRGLRLVDAISSARHSLEADWGVHNLELPLSKLTETAAFHWFAAHILAQLPAFHRLYNESTVRYRTRNRVRSRNHPVPDLAVAGEWLEAPFWVWRQGQSLRDRVFARQHGEFVELRDAAGTFISLPLSAEKSACCAVEALANLPDQGIRFRTRALTTTLFSRIFLADLFIHGIGGAKYDEMTDELCAAFYGIQPPAFQTVTATMRLPISELPDVHPRDLERLVQLDRELRLNAERNIRPPADSEASKFVQTKRDILGEMASLRERTDVSEIATRAGMRRLYQQLSEVRSRLCLETVAERSRLASELGTLTTDLSAQRLLTSREYSFALFPEDTLKATLLPLARGG